MGLDYTSARLKLDWANKHLKNLDREIRAFLGGNPYEIFPYAKLETGDIVYHLGSLATIPNEIALLAGDIIHNLRSSLDHVAHVVFESTGRDGGNNYQFPIISNERFINGGLDREIEKVCPVDSREGALFKTLKPYEGGNEDIWRIHRLDIHDKHKLLIQAFFKSTKTREVHISVTNFDTGENLDIPDISVSGYSSPSFSGDPLKDGAIVHKVSRGDIHTDNVDMHPEFVIDIAFVEPAEVRGFNVLETLNKLGSVTQYIISAFEELP